MRNKRSRTLHPACWTFLMTATVATAMASAAASTAPAPQNPGAPAAPAQIGNIWISGSSGLFRGAGEPRTLVVSVLSWADEIARGFEKFTGLTIPRNDAAPIYLWLLPADAHRPPGVQRVHVVQPWGIAHRLEIHGAEQVPPAALNAELTALFLDRCAVYRQKPEVRKDKPASVPYAIALGTSRCLIPNPRGLALRAAREAWIGGADSNPAHWLTRTAPCDATDTALCTAAVAWMHEQNPEWLTAVVQTVSEGNPLAPERLAQIAGCSGTPSMIHSWALWIASADQRQTPWLIPIRDRIRDVRDSIQLDPALWPDPLPFSPDETVGIDALLAHRGKDWIEPVARYLVVRLRQVPTGQPPELDRAARQIEQILLDVRHPEPSIFWRWLPVRDRTSTLKRQWKEAESTLTDLEWVVSALPQARAEVERELAPDHSPPPPASEK